MGPTKCSFSVSAPPSGTVSAQRYEQCPLSRKFLRPGSVSMPGIHVFCFVFIVMVAFSPGCQVLALLIIYLDVVNHPELFRIGGHSKIE